MPYAILIGDPCTGHGGFPSRPAIEGDQSILIAGKAPVRVGDAYDTHCKPKHGCHSGVLSAGSGTVTFSGKAAGREGDPISCGSTATASITSYPNINIG